MQLVAQKTMQAAAIDHFGGIENISMKTLPVPELGPDEILIRVESAGVGQWDPFEREGGFVDMMSTQSKFPYVMGTDGAGTVVAVGESVTKFKEGDRVYAMSFLSPKGGFYAEFAAVKADNASIIPSGLSTEQAGALATDAITALRGLDDTLRLQPGERIMIFGASGGVGHFAVQLAKRMGARVLAAASGEDGVALVRSLGADAALDGHRQDVERVAREFAPDGLDAALLAAGGQAAERALAAMRQGGRVAYPHGVEPEPKVRDDLQVLTYDGMPDAEILERLNGLIEAGPFQVHIDHVFPLDKAADAQRAIETHHLGKLALRPG